MSTTKLTKSELEKVLKIISRAWGRTQSGYAFFPYIDREEQIKTGLRRSGYHETKPFLWPQAKDDIVDYLYEHQGYDVYWCPSLFEYPDRRLNNAMDEHALWADLDEVRPDEIDLQYKPTIAWETSPGRYQCLWIAAAGDFLGASWPGNENQRMTYMIGADASGWDTTQLLRLPNWTNHKPNYRTSDGQCPQGVLLWSNGPTYQPGDFSELPEVQGFISADVSDALEADIANVDRYKVIARVKLKLNKRARELLKAKDTGGADVSAQLWYLIRCLADAHCSIAEIVAVVKETIWNKFRDRADELHTLIGEASKAIAKKPEVKDEIEEEDDLKSPPRRFAELLANVKKPRFLVEGIISEGACGFIAGEPKSFKSWVGLDLAISVSTGSDFLNYFRINEPGPVLYIQEEDPLPTLKTRTAKIWSGKSVDKMVLVQENGMLGVEWLPASASEKFNPDINASVQKSFTISDEEWLLWLDDVLAQGMDGKRYKLILLDTLMMTAGDVEENKSQEMTSKVFKPLKVMSRKHNVAVYLIHHMSKTEKARPGQRMLGSTANHAWAEDSIYLSTSGKKIRIDLESKQVPPAIWAVENVVGSLNWQPEVTAYFADDKVEVAAKELPKDYNWPQNLDNAPNASIRTVWARNNAKARELADILRNANSRGLSVTQVAAQLNVAPGTAKARLKRFVERGDAKVNNNYYTLSTSHARMR